MIGLARWSYNLLLLLLVATLALPLSTGLPRTAPRNRAPHPWRSRPAAGESPTIDRIRANGKLRAGVAVTPWLLQDPFDQGVLRPDDRSDRTHRRRVGGSGRVRRFRMGRPHRGSSVRQVRLTAADVRHAGAHEGHRLRQLHRGRNLLHCQERQRQGQQPRGSQ